MLRPLLTAGVRYRPIGVGRPRAGNRPINGSSRSPLPRPGRPATKAGWPIYRVVVNPVSASLRRETWLLLQSSEQPMLEER